MHYLLEQLLDLIFPKTCVACGKTGSYLCPQCFAKIEFFTGTKSLNEASAYLDELIVTGCYQQPLDKLIKVMKYKSVKDIATLLGQMIWQYGQVSDCDIYTAVAISKTRKNYRGFNQAQLIAQKIAQLSHKPYYDLLIKNKTSQNQASLHNKEKRLKNLANCFIINQQLNKNIYTAKSILLVDDVTTTGATLNECAKVLKQAGASKICGLAVASKI